ncbi:alpha-glucosidase-like [Venturia canescens]|uniref:alpha-glucosidase-like n=1 Tax=Venturia canescens TaxID=32260 RepID=UPI001C9CDAA5|nr:alpha-glucosidase-like [Venturia canescens]
MRSLAILVWLLGLAFLGVDGIGKEPKEWWKDSFIYQVYTRSFKDSDGDGIGDLNGISSKLEYLVDLNVSALLIAPIYTSPMMDFGYDIANYTEVDPVYGNLSDFTNLTAKAKSLGLKVLLEFIPNHSSDQHPWFQKSIQKIKPYDDYYIWQDAKLVNGTKEPPNNWLSVYGGSAWEWHPVRGQFYFHQFAIGQPDLNYRDAALDLEMQKALIFWLDHGVDGFRINGIDRLLEDASLADEPEVIGGNGSASNDYDSLEHIFTKDLNDSYVMLKSWRKIIDAHSKKASKGEPKMILTEAATSLPLTMQYFDAGSNAPLNWMFISDLDNNSRTFDFKRLIDRWMNAMPKAASANWVVGNNDNHRAATRLGPKRADQLSMLATVLPGVGIIYYGDEIGMEDMWLSYNDTVDPAGCNAGPTKYILKSRDPERTPFQWDATASAGFSSSNNTWLPVNPNYKSFNLAAQKATPVSHYSVFKKLVKLKKQPVMKTGSMEIILVDEDILGVVRKDPDLGLVALLINFSESTVVVDARTWMNIPDELFVYASSVHSGIPSGVTMDTTVLNLPGAASVILSSEELVS